MSIASPARSAWAFAHRFASPPHFYRIASALIPWVGGACAVLLAVGLYLGLVVAPPDYQQGESYRIIFVHVPSAWMSLFAYVVMATCGAIVLIWRMKLADIVANASAPVPPMVTPVASPPL